MLLADAFSIRLENNPLNVHIKHSATLCAIFRRKSGRVLPVTLKIITACSIADVLLHFDEMILAFHTFTPIAGVLGMKPVMNPT